MDARRFDALAIRLSRRLPRRTALVTAAGGLAAALLGAAARSSGTAQDATPAASPGASPAASPAAGADPELLFVQVYQAGTWTPAPGEAGVYLLALTGHTAETVYFSDRPERLVGTIPTREFLDTLGFAPADPPNAAVVAQTPDGGEDVLVVELFDPTYAEGGGADGGASVTYRARVLAAYEGEGLASLAARQGDGQLPESFGPASLFIDAPAAECPPSTIVCYDSACKTRIGDLGRMNRCRSFLSCCPCGGATKRDAYSAECNRRFPACNGRCKAHDTGDFWCFSCGGVGPLA